jgi:hypothetical protein
MRHLRICTALAVLFALGAAVAVEARGKRAAPGTVSGRIAGLNQGSISIARRNKSRTGAARVYTFALTAQTAVVLPNGKPAPLNALQMGVRVRVGFQVAPMGALVATQIQIRGR